jgi:PAS domain S-box-containing protein
MSKDGSRFRRFFGEGRRAEISVPAALFLLATVAAGIFLTEALIMLLLPLDYFSPRIRALLDASVLVVFTFPVLYFFFYRPTTVSMRQLRKALLRVRKSEEIYKELVEYTDAVHWEMDARTKRFTYVSPQVEKVLCYPVTDWVDHGFWVEHLHPEDRHWAPAYCAHYAALGKDHEFTFRMIAADDRVVWIRAIVNVVMAAGVPVKLRGMMLDVTACMLAEETLKESEEKYRTVIENASDAIILVDADSGVVLDANRRATELTGRDIAELIGLHHSELHPAEETERYTDLFKKRTGGESGVSGEDLVVRHASGRRVPVEISSSVIELTGRKVLIGIFRDISERKAAERELRKWAEVFRNARWGITLQEKESPVMGVTNPAFARLYGYSPEELSERPFEEVFAPGRKEDVRVLMQVLGEKGHHTFESVHQRADGRFFPVLVTATALKDEDGHMLYRVVSVLDISEQKEAEENLRLLRKAVEALPVGVTITDLKRRVLYTNPAEAAMHGYAVEELLGRDARCLGSEVSKRGISREEMVNGIPYNRESRNRRKDGTDFPVHLISVPVVQENGEPLGMITVAEDISHRKDAERELRIKEIAIRSSMNAMAFADLEGAITYVNESCLSMWGCEGAAEVVGRFGGEFLRDKQEAHVVLDALRTHGNWIGELTARRKDGTPFDIQCVAGLVRDEGGDALCIMLSAVDVTERKTAETALRESEERYRSFVHNFQGIAFRTSMDSTPLFLHGAVEKITGYAEKDFLERKPPWEDIIHPDDRERTAESLNALVSSPGPMTEREYRIVRRDGEVRWIYELLQKAGDPSGRLYLQGSLYDITQRKIAEESLRINEWNYRKLSREFNTLLNAIPDPLLLLSPDLDVIWANAGAAAVIGRDKVDFLSGLRCHDLWFKSDRPCEGCPVVRCFESGQGESEAMEHTAGRLWDVRAFPIKDEKTDRVKNVIALLIDITEKTRLEGEARRAAQLASVGELAAGTAHEINNPINSIINYAQVVADRYDEDTKESDYCRRIIKEGNRIAAIVRGLLSFARQDSGEKCLVKVEDVLRDVLALTRAAMAREGVRIAVDSEPDLPPVWASYRQLEQVFLNLLSNAQHALEEKYPSQHEDKVLYISCGMAESEGIRYVRSIFHDRGLGIPAHLLQKVHEPFFTTKPQGKGTGLGLSISYGIIKEHGGAISIKSTPGEFTRVIVDLPEVKGHEEEDSGR